MVIRAMSEKAKILFVDDESDILAGLRRMLHSMRHQWSMEFVKSGKDALEVMAREHIDIIVADMRMPGMDGAELLEIISQKYPHVIRIVLSGQADEQTVFRVVNPSHQYLSKPCSAEHLKFIVTRSLHLRRILSSEKLKEIISKIDTLPSLPRLYQELVNALKAPDITIKEVGKIISQDIGITAKILKLVNSAYFGLPRRISDPAQAVSYLGLDVIKAIVLSVQTFSQFEHTSLKHLSLERLISHSLQTGNLARQIALEHSGDPAIANDGFLAGLLHDVGKIILAQQFPDLYDQAVLLSKSQNCPIWEAEEAVLGGSHAEVGAYLIGLWGLSEQIVIAIAFHHYPSKSVPEGFNALTAVHVANALADETNAPPNDDLPPQLDQDYLISINCLEKISVWRQLRRPIP